MVFMFGGGGGGGGGGGKVSSFLLVTSKFRFEKEISVSQQPLRSSLQKQCSKENYGEKHANIQQLLL